jgi:hypothetical protein
MRRVVILVEAAEDLEEARSFYDAQEAGVGDWVQLTVSAVSGDAARRVQ